MIIGVDVPTAGELSDPRRSAQEAEALGFDFVSANDHVLGGAPRNEGWTHLVWLAAHTQRVRVVSRVLGVPYRNAVLLAKMAESLARMSGGRLLLGLGAGSGEDEYRAMGLAAASIADRVVDLGDTIEIVRALWTGETVSYRGRQLAIDDVRLQPPADRPIPIWLGTAGPRGLELVGSLADGWIPSVPYVTPDNAVSKIDRIRRAAERAGRNPEGLDLVYNLEVSFEPALAADVSGNPDEIVDRLRGFVDLGFTGFNLQPVGRDRSTDLARLASEVVPHLRQA